jgi:hypothetical protein
MLDDRSKFAIALLLVTGLLAVIRVLVVARVK